MTDDEKKELIDKIHNHLRENMPDGDDSEFWNDNDRVQEHIFNVLKSKLHMGVPRMDYEFDETTGEVHITIHKPAIEWKEDNDD